METSLDEIFTRLEAVGEKTEEAILAELEKIKKEFDAKIEWLAVHNLPYRDTQSFIWEVIAREKEIVAKVVAAIKPIVKPVSEPVVKPIPEPIIEIVPKPVVPEVFNTPAKTPTPKEDIKPVTLEVKNVVIKPTITKPTAVKSTTPKPKTEKPKQ
jgi:hypothetical protein